MSFTCPDCDSDLESTVREIELEEGETAQILDSGTLVVTKVACSNGCSDKKKEKPKRQKKERSSPAAETSGESCPRSDLCSKAPGHQGRCNTKLAEKA